MNKFLLPLAAFIALLAVFAVGLTLNPRALPSPLVDKAAPAARAAAARISQVYKRRAAGVLDPDPSDETPPA